MNPIINRITQSFSQSSSWGFSSARQSLPRKRITFSRMARSIPSTAKTPLHRRLPLRGKPFRMSVTNAGVQAYIGDKTEVIDLKGQMLLPGFVDSHIHPMLAMFAGGADLQYDSIEEVLASVRKWADANPDAQ